MDNQYLQDLINEAKQRGGGMILDVDGKPEIVVLTINKYNDLISNIKLQISNEQADVQKARENQKIREVESQRILVTGGAGYIGAHAVEELIDKGYEAVIIDNLSVGKRENLHPKAKFYEGDLKDLNFLRDIFLEENIAAVMHFAASIEVEESVREPQKYFENNVLNTGNLLRAMNEANCKKIIFSSTAAVYGEAGKGLVSEISPVRPVNPYGYSKLLAEKTIKFYSQFAGFKAIVFRYFNACGCRTDGSVVPTHSSHLIDNIMEVAVGNKPTVSVFGQDFETFDGSGVRDYVHVKDIARAHVFALEHLGGSSSVRNHNLSPALSRLGERGYKELAFQVFNIGTGKGSSVLQIINSTAEILNKIIPMEISPRRSGDPAELVADCGKIFSEWGFKTEHSDLETIIKSAYRQKVNFQ